MITICASGTSLGLETIHTVLYLQNSHGAVLKYQTGKASKCKFKNKYRMCTESKALPGDNDS